MATTSAAGTEAKGGPLSPFSHTVFTVLWLATLVGNIGLWLRDTASSWLMTELTSSPLLIASVQLAATLPIFLFSLPAGALADIVDRRRMMIAIQSGLALVSVSLAVLTWLGVMTPALIIAATLIAGIGTALTNPVWQSIVPELVPRADLRPAIALNSLGINIARAIGPALAGAIILSFGVAAAYATDVLTYLATLVALIWWKRAPAKSDLPEHFGGAVRGGVRYALGSRPLQRVLLRAVLFFASASCYWALLPIIARAEFGGGPAGYGVLMGALGGGAIAGALLMPMVRRHVMGETLVLGAALLHALVTIGLAFVGNVAAGAALLAFGGAAWISVLTTLNATAQGVLPNWVRGRGLALYLTAFYGAMAAGSWFWGQLAESTSIDTTLIAAGISAALLAVLAMLWPLPSTEDDLTPSHHWPEPALAEGIAASGGPVMVTIDYRVAIADQPAFLAAAQDLGRIRRRDGAYDWGIMADAEDPQRITEWFLVPSWEEHLRQHARVTHADEDLQNSLRAFHKGDAPPAVRHLIPVRPAPGKDGAQ